MKTSNAKKIFAALAAVAAVTAVAAPAAAQPYGYDRHDQSYDQRSDRRYEDGRYHNGWTSRRVQAAERRIESGLRSGQLTRREAARLRDDLQDFARLEARARRGGMSGWERAQVERRWDQLIAAIRYETRDREYGYGYGHRR